MDGTSDYIREVQDAAKTAPEKGNTDAVPALPEISEFERAFADINKKRQAEGLPEFGPIATAGAFVGWHARDEEVSTLLAQLHSANERATIYWNLLGKAGEEKVALEAQLHSANEERERAERERDARWDATPAPCGCPVSYLYVREGNVACGKCGDHYSHPKDALARMNQRQAAALPELKAEGLDRLEDVMRGVRRAHDGGRSHVLNSDQVIRLDNFFASLSTPTESGLGED